MGRYDKYVQPPASESGGPGRYDKYKGGATRAPTLAENINTAVATRNEREAKYGYKPGQPWEAQSEQWKVGYFKAAQAELEKEAKASVPFRERAPYSAPQLPSAEAIKARAMQIAKANNYAIMPTPVNRMSFGDAAVTGANSINPLATVAMKAGDVLLDGGGAGYGFGPNAASRAFDNAITKSVQDQPTAHRLGQAGTLAATQIAAGFGNSPQMIVGGTQKLMSPAMAARLAKDTLLMKGVRYTGRVGALGLAGTGELALFNAIAEAPNRAREAGEPMPTMGDRLNYAASELDNPWGWAPLPLASIGGRTIRGAVTSGKNTIQATMAANRGAPKPEVMAAGLGNLPKIKFQAGSFTPSDVQARVALARTVDPNTGKSLRDRVIDEFIAQGFDADQAETAVRILAYNGVSEVPEALFEVSPALQEMAVVAGRLQGKPAQKMLQQMFTDRKEEFPNALREALRKATGASGDDMEEFLARMKQAGTEASSDGYTAAYGKTVSDDTWQRIMGLVRETPDAADAARKGAELARNSARRDPAKLEAARQLDELANAISRGGVPNEKLSTMALDFLDRGIGRKVSVATRAGDNAYSSSLLDFRGALRGSGLDAETGLNVPRTIYAQHMAVAKAVEFGEKAAGKAIPLRKMKQQFVAAMRAADEAFEDGIGEGSSIIDTGLMQGWIRGAENFIEMADNPQTAIRQLYGSERQREKLLSMMRELPEGASSGLKSDNTKRIKALVGSKPGKADYKAGFTLSTGQKVDADVELPSLFARQKSMLESERQIVGSSVTGNVNEAMANQLGTRNSVESLLMLAENAWRSPARMAARVIDNIRAPKLLRDPEASRVIGELLTTRGRDRLLAVIDEIRARQAVTGKGPRQPGGAPVPPPGPIRAGGFAGFGGKRPPQPLSNEQLMQEYDRLLPRLDKALRTLQGTSAETVPGAKEALLEAVARAGKAGRGASDDQIIEEAWAMTRRRQQNGPNWPPRPETLEPVGPDQYMGDLSRMVSNKQYFEVDLETAIRESLTDLDDILARQGMRRADDMIPLDQLKAQLEDPRLRNADMTRPNGLVSGLRSDLGGAVGGALFSGAMPMEEDATLQDRLTRAGVGALLGASGMRASRMVARQGADDLARTAGVGGGGRLGRAPGSPSQAELPKAPAQIERQTGRPSIPPTRQTEGWYRRVWGADKSARNGSSWRDPQLPSSPAATAVRIARRIAQTRPDMNVGRAISKPGRTIAAGMRALDRRLRSPEDPRLLQPAIAPGQMRIPASGNMPTNKPAIERMANPAPAAEELAGVRLRAEKAYGKERQTGIVPGRTERALETMKKVDGYMRGVSQRLEEMRAASPTNEGLKLAVEARKASAARYRSGMEELARLITSGAPADQIAKVTDDVNALRAAMKAVIEKPKRAPGMAQLERIDAEIRRALQDVDAGIENLWGPSGRQIRRDQEVADLLTNPARAPDAAKVAQAKPLGSHEMKGQALFWSGVGGAGALGVKAMQDSERRKKEDFYAARDAWDHQTKDEPSFTGPRLQEVQTFLNYVVPLEEGETPLVPDGKFGKQTADRLRRYQEMRGLTVNGKRTWETISDLEAQMYGAREESTARTGTGR